MRNLLIVFLGVSFCLFAQTPSWADATNATDVKQVQADVSAILRGVYGNDAETVMRYTHDTIITMLGGKDKALATTRQSLSDRRFRHRHRETQVPGCPSVHPDFRIRICSCSNQDGAPLKGKAR